MNLLAPLVFMAMAARADPLAVTSSDGQWLVGATRRPEVAAWRLDDLTSRSLPSPGPKSPRVAGLCVRDGRVAMASDWGARVVIVALDGTPVLTLDPGARRVTAVRCLGDGWALLAWPAQPSADPDAAGLGPGFVVVYDGQGREMARHAPTGGVVVFALAPAEAELALADATGGLWRGPVRGPLRADPAPLPAGVAALAYAPDGRLFAASAEAVCAVGGACVAGDGGAGLLVAGAGWLAVGGYEATTLLARDDLKVCTTFSGRPAGLHALPDGRLLVVTGRTVLTVEPRTGAVLAERVLAEPEG